MKSHCANCRFRKYAEANPESFWSKLWKWRTTWRPGWKAYQRELAGNENDNK